MKFIAQTRSGSDDGNCFEACIASVLEMEDVEEVLRYNESNQDMRPYLRRLDAWLAERGKIIVAMNGPEVDFAPDDLIWIGSFETSGPDAGHTHAIVVQGSTPLWDPQTQERNPAVSAPLRSALFVVDREAPR